MTYPETFKTDLRLSPSRESFLYFDLNPWISVLSMLEHRNKTKQGEKAKRGQIKSYTDI